jgi:hypothetical protein
MPDLTAAVRAVEALMTDTVTVTRDAQGAGDDVLDETTGLLVRPDGDSAVVYTGPWLVTPADSSGGRGGSAALLGALATSAPDSTATYRGLLPLTAPALRPGDVLTATAVRSDALLAGRRFRVRAEPELSSLPVARIVGLDLL